MGNGYFQNLSFGLVVGAIGLFLVGCGVFTHSSTASSSTHSHASTNQTHPSVTSAKPTSSSPAKTSPLSSSSSNASSSPQHAAGNNASSTTQSSNSANSSSASSNTSSTSSQGSSQAAGPVLLSMRPTSGPPGTVVTFMGSNFGTVPGRVTFTPTSGRSDWVAIIRSWTPTVIQCAIPEGLPTGNAYPSLWTARGTPVGPGSDAAWPLFTVGAAAPVVTGLSPIQAPAGTLLTITGQGFGSTPGQVTVCQFCGTNAQISAIAPIVSWQSTRVQVKVPGLQNGGAEVYLVTASKQGVRAGTIFTGGEPSSSTSSSVG